MYNANTLAHVILAHARRVGTRSLSADDAIADLQSETAIDESVYDLIRLLSGLAIGQSCEWDSGAGGIRRYTRIS